jgi:hypothetical protein
MEKAPWPKPYVPGLQATAPWPFGEIAGRGQDIWSDPVSARHSVINEDRLHPWLLEYTQRS